MDESEAIVDFATLEREKENITANRNGHSALALQQTFSVPRNQRQQQLAAAKERFCRELEEAHAESPDPLDSYVKFVEWTIDSYPSGKSSDSGLLPLLELATRTFKDDPQYKFDLRYLNLWLQYAALVEKPELIYAYLIANDIGQSFAILYEEYANALERRGNRAQADEVYRLGLARRAKPAGVLQLRYEEFQMRMLSANPDSRPDSGLGDSTQAPGGRRALGGRSTGSRTAPQPQSQPSSSATPAPRPGPIGNRGKISVFVDAQSSTGEYQSNEWKSIGSEAARDKENSAEATPWVGERLHQVALQTPRTPKFTVLKDDTDQVRTNPHKTPESIAIRPPSQRPPTETELLFHDPFKNYGESVTDLTTARIPPPDRILPPSRVSQPDPLVQSSTRSTQDTSKFPKPRAFIPPDPIVNIPGQPPRKPEKYMFKLDLLWNEKEEKEYCAAEARAKSMGLLTKIWPPPPFIAQMDGSTHFEPIKSTGGGSRIGRVSMAREPTVTINTKFAMNDVFDMFNGAGIEEEEDSFEDEAGPNELGSKIPAMGLERSDIPPTPTPFGRSVSASFTPFVDASAAAKPAVTPKFAPFVDPGPEAAKADRALLGHGRPAPTIGTAAARAASGPSALGSTSSKIPRFQPFVDPAAETQQSGKRAPLSAKAPEKAPALRDAGDTAGSAKPRGVPPLRPFVDSGEALDVPPTPTPSSTGGRAPQILEVPTTIAEEAEHSAERSAATVKPSRSFNIFRDVAPAKPPSPNQSSVRPPPASSGDIFGSRSDDIFLDSNPGLANPSTSNSLPEITFVPSPETTQDHAKNSSQLSYTGKENSNADPFAQLRNATGLNQGDGSDWSEDKEEDEQVQLQEGDPEIAEQLDGSEHTDEFDEDEPPPSFRLKRFAAFDEMTPITERTYEFTRTSSELATSARRPSAAHGKPRISEVSRPRKSVGRARASIAPSRPEEEPIPNPCNPFEEPILSELLELAWVDFMDYRDRTCGQLERLQRFGAKKLRGSTDKRRSSAVGDTIQLTLGEDKFEIMGKLGEGGFGAVFQARLLGLPDEEAEEDVFFAMKAVKPCQLWEWAILAQIREAVPAELLPSIIAPQGLYAFQDESYLLLDHCSQGTLLDCVNRAAGTELAPPTADGIVEPLVVFFTIELFRVVEGLHSQGVIHGDLKIDNCLLRLADSGSSWSAQYDPTGGNGWGLNGIRLIDFGRAIDTTFFPEDQTYCGDWPADARDCPEIREGRPWTFETDYWGLAGIIYCLLYRKYIDTTSVVGPDGVKRYKLATPFKRYWNTDMWTRVFDVLLNPKSVLPDHVLPISNELAGLREEMEQWLVVNSVKGKSGLSLKVMLKKILQQSL